VDRPLWQGRPVVAAIAYRLLRRRTVERDVPEAFVPDSSKLARSAAGGGVIRNTG